MVSITKQHILVDLSDNLPSSVSPNGIMFVKPEVRKSLLAKMLSELLDTRVMVKNGMKAASGNKVSSLSDYLNIE